MVRQEAVNSLLADIRNRLDRLSAAQHRMARDHRILTDAATQLRLGKSAEAVLAEIRDQSPDVLGDFCDLQLRIALAPLRSIGRVAVSA